jgi:hypothetical protein
MSQAVYLTSARAERAIELAEAGIFKLMETVTNHKAIHIVILGIEGQILFEKSVGPDVEWDQNRLAVCVEIARSKAQIHFRTGKPSAEIQARRPTGLVVGDTIYGGSAAHEGVIVGASGVQSFYDETIAAIVAAILWGLCMEAHAAFMKQAEKSPIYKQPL